MLRMCGLGGGGGGDGSGWFFAFVSFSSSFCSAFIFPALSLTRSEFFNLCLHLYKQRFELVVMFLSFLICFAASLFH
ncbi:hypothetical protein BJ741DRAFT_205244 [Chytriomyces cf. hyalinus JEL632]|nr:hypothetical protein BJ741DRAFT_205244 [Chytriomyces cf. hyalinus JEL632]